MNQVSIYILDISVLLCTPSALFEFPDKELIIPVTILEELDSIKMDLGENGRSAQLVCQILDDCRQYGNLVNGISLPNGGKLRIELTDPESGLLPYNLNLKKISNRVLAVAWILTQKNKDLVFVSQNDNLRTKANTLGVSTLSYNGNRPNDSNLYSGIRRIRVGKQKLKLLGKQSYFSPEEIFSDQNEICEFFANEGLLLSCTDFPDEKILATYQHDKKKFELVPKEQGVWGLRPLNSEQHFALSLLMNTKISVVTLSGISGTGKTLLALAVGLQQLMVDKTYSRMLVSRPIFPMGRDLGYLPGDTQEKLAPWMQPIFDNLAILINSHASKNGSKHDSYNELIDRGMLVVEPLTYIRGRTIPNQYMIVDEAQNLTPHEMKTILTRVGEGTKIVLTGDPNQIDNSEVNLSSNGLSTLVESFKASPLAGHVRFTSVERSPLAELAAKVL